MWLPLFHDRLDTLFDYAGAEALFGLGALAAEAAGERLGQAEDYFAARNEAAGEERTARVLAPGALYLTPSELEAGLSSGASARFVAASDDGADLGGKSGRNFAPERMQPDTNIFEITAAHAKAKRAEGKAVVFAAWTEGSAERLVSVMGDHLSLIHI